jgi:general secretion pathway protein E
MTSLATAYCVRWRICPASSDPGEYLCAEEPPGHVQDDLARRHGVQPTFLPVSEDGLLAALERYAAGGLESASAYLASLGPVEEERDESSGEDLLQRAEDAPVVRLVNMIVAEALAARASDIHVEAEDRKLVVRYRVDGVLSDGPTAPSSLTAAIVARLKIMANLDIAERRRPQDGRVRARIGDRFVDIRMSTIPSLAGESIVLRLLEQSTTVRGLEHLGMPDDTRRCIEDLLRQPNGLILVTGPTGSGKTTTLYAALERLRTGSKKILTIEDPVEYAVQGVTQVPVNRKAGTDFPSALRSMLRQDPDIILVGEMRDAETAQVCIQAAMTGHLVLSTLHTNSAAGAVERLVDLGVPSFLIRGTVRGVLAQRLVRVVCQECAVDEQAAGDLVAQAASTGVAIHRVRRGRGCPDCRGSGFKGRTGIYELLALTGKGGGACLNGEVVDTARQALPARSMRADGFRHIRDGVTTPEEVFAATTE